MTQQIDAREQHVLSPHIELKPEQVRGILSRVRQPDIDVLGETERLVYYMAAADHVYDLEHPDEDQTTHRSGLYLPPLASKYTQARGGAVYYGPDMLKYVGRQNGTVGVSERPVTAYTLLHNPDREQVATVWDSFQAEVARAEALRLQDVTPIVDERTELCIVVPAPFPLFGLDSSRTLRTAYNRFGIQGALRPRVVETPFDVSEVQETAARLLQQHGVHLQ